MTIEIEKFGDRYPALVSIVVRQEEPGEIQTSGIITARITTTLEKLETAFRVYKLQAENEAKVKAFYESLNAPEAKQ